MSDKRKDGCVPSGGQKQKGVKYLKRKCTCSIRNVLWCAKQWPTLMERQGLTQLPGCNLSCYSELNHQSCLHIYFQPGLRSLPWFTNVIFTWLKEAAFPSFGGSFPLWANSWLDWSSLVLVMLQWRNVSVPIRTWLCKVCVSAQIAHPCFCDESLTQW